jgi:hypothetical protein
VPIDKPNIKYESKYSGVWSETNSRNIRYEIKQFGDFEYLIIQLPDSVSKDDNSRGDDTKQSDNVTSSSDTTVYTGHISKIKDFYFLNLRAKNEGFFQSKQYSIYKIEFVGNDELRLTEITSNIKEQFDDSGDLKNYIEKYMDAGISFFYGAETAYLKVK